MRKHARGMTLIELMVAVAIVAIIAAIAYPSFTDGLRKSRRAEGFKGLLTMQLKQEEYRVSNSSYSPTLSAVGNPASDYYNFSISGASATGYTLIATAKGAQSGDNSGATSCNTLTLTKADAKTPAACWK
ncbi:type IV pilin protein [Aeromonas rivuli]|uniref:type IV pilin protein n=1 Tax=Aeromonas rivuli TaxID=648794 RepID=UPI0005AA7144|nr:type IV pilin protein [Aeromonas rivuli]